MMKAITTIPPYAPYINKIASHPIVSGVRLNTVMPIKEGLEYMLERIQKETDGKDIWIDLKTRQVRVTNYATTPYQHLEISHNIKANYPIKAYFNDGYDEATIAAIDGNKLIMLDGPKRVVGPGESINIIDPSLEIEGFLTEGDKRYIEAAKATGVHTYMLSYVEKESDITDVLELDPDAQILAKIESPKGMKFVSNVFPKYKSKINLMAARGDLYVEVEKPHMILNAVRKIVRADPDAVVASRIFTSLRDCGIPACQDISDIGYLLEIGTRRVMVGDDVCFNEDSVMGALNLLDDIVYDYRV